ncbi:ADAMTS-like protein 3 isoform X2 [Lingula anatina]|uniref:ADAMTS-like protein 3 isoform X2 n=1 Tax=Lingula anatina TaxID=7574 RepID=A0A1S3JTD2_LINAN|nr:ADAMTS-like protein 3 isoform X2 [Lingula anatina]|eukprot:XP_013413578.1 ADAMTS-like protein 3 isoform X2 [Lingula anatina]
MRMYATRRGFSGLWLVLTTLLGIQRLCAGSHWSGWSGWSGCSRTCDGGASYQLRRCTDWSCQGASIRYKTCNSKPCPDSTVDFRGQQCAAYNDVPYYNQLYQWEAYHEPRDPCSLRCKPKGHDFGVMLAPKVLDGTRCNPTSLDMCINGECRTVGCDHVLDSKTVVDACGVCGGDSSTCQQTRQTTRFHWREADYSECSVTCGVGYRVTSTVCVDTWRNQIIHSGYCELKNKPKLRTQICQAPSSCIPVWKTEDWQACSKSCGGGTAVRKVYCVRELENGKFDRTADKMCTGSKPANKQSCNVQECPRWYAGPWSLCSVTCGTGVQYREVICKQVDDLQCSIEDKPISAQDCDTQTSCIGETAETNDRSGQETVEASYRLPRVFDDKNAVEEFDNSAGDRVNAISASADKKDTMMAADKPAPPIQADQAISSTPTFIATEWGPCSTTCGQGVKIRLVQCKVYLAFSRSVVDLPDSECSEAKPHEIEQCSYGNCSALMIPFDNIVPEQVYLWKSLRYTACSAQCLGGFQESIVECVRASDDAVVEDSMCAASPKLSSVTRVCGDGPCPPRWRVGAWGHCSTTCGRGTQTRSVQCIQQLARGEDFTAAVPEDFCPVPKPESDRECNLAECPPFWHVGNWTTCSTPCGGGLQSRMVMCQQVTPTGSIIKVTNEAECLEERPLAERKCNSFDCFNKILPKPAKIRKDLSHYVQLKPMKRILLIVGGKATVIPQTTILVRCPVKNYPQSEVEWTNDGAVIPKSNHHSRLGLKGHHRILRIRKSRLKDAGIYTCSADGVAAAISIDFHSEEQAAKLHSLRKKYMRSHISTDVISDSWNEYNGSSSYSFVTSDWGVCSQTCGGRGIQMTNVSCEMITDTSYKILPQQMCLDAGLVKPRESRGCGWAECPHWTLGEWSECSNDTCLGHATATQQMQLYCSLLNGTYVDNANCDRTRVPSTSRHCHNPHCHAVWEVSPWTKCSKTCGETGIRSRMLKCVWSGSGIPAGINCRNMDRPHAAVTCEMPACPNDCYDQSKFCGMVQRLNMCRFRDYKTRCCYSCS